MDGGDEAGLDHLRSEAGALPRVGGDRVLAIGSWRAQWRGGGVPLDFPQASWLTQWRRGKLILLQTFTDRNEALEAAGLEE